jgi:hypothetical protein
MSRTLTVELPDATYDALRARADAEGCEPEDVVRSAIDQRVAQPSHPGLRSGEFDLSQLFGLVRLGAEGRADNEQIDADLAKEYAGEAGES